MKKPLRVAHMTTQWLTVLVVASLSLCLFAHAAGPKSAKPAGQPVTVTPEMIGAGIVSSGAVLPSIPPVTGSRENPVAAWTGPLPYPVVVADRRNNRLIEIAPDKRIVWEFPSPNLKIYRGNDDVFFSPDGRRLMVNEEDNYDIHIVDYQTRSITWTFGASEPRPLVKASGSTISRSKARTTRSDEHTMSRAEDKGPAADHRKARKWRNASSAR
jgi:hypothetical protein